MNTIVRRIVPVIAALAVAACASDSSTGPQPEVASAAARSTPGTPGCNFNQTKQDARSFFASSADPIFATIRGMQSVYNTRGATAATAKGFDALQQIAAARGTAAQSGTAAAGNSLTKDFLGCMNVGPIPSGFDVTTALSSGIYEVRGGASDAAGAALAQVASAGQKSTASPIWGIESVSPSAWGAKFNGNTTRFLVYGAPLPVSSFTSEPAANNGNAAYTGFEISTLPAMPGLTLVNANGSTGQVRVGICIDEGTGSTANLLLHHGSGGTTILQLSPLSFCGGIGSNQIAPAGGFLASLARGALSLITPTPAYALLGGVGGLPSGLSPFGPVGVRADSVVLKFKQQPSNGNISAPISPPVQVQATTPSGTPIGGVTISLRVVGNNGINAFVTADSIEVTSDAVGLAGIATFPKFGVTKAGGYTIQAVGSLNGSSTLSVISNLFNMKNK